MLWVQDTERSTATAGQTTKVLLSEAEQSHSPGPLGLNVRSVTLTSNSLGITYSKETVEIKPEGYVGVDRNLDNVTIASTDKAVKTFDLSKATGIKSTYRLVNSRFKRNDTRIRTRVLSKIVDQAKTRRYGIVMERLTGIRRLYQKGNGQSRNYRARMNSWSFGELQRQIEYKARWEGVKVIYVPARNTSKRCSVCGYKTLESTQRQLWCPHCGAILDRDENAARNISARGLRFSPNGPPGEAMVEEREQGERDPNPQSRWRQVKSTNQRQKLPDEEDLTEPQNSH